LIPPKKRDLEAFGANPSSMSPKLRLSAEHVPFREGKEEHTWCLKS